VGSTLAPAPQAFLPGQGFLALWRLPHVSLTPYPIAGPNRDVAGSSSYIGESISRSVPGPTHCSGLLHQVVVATMSTCAFSLRITFISSGGVDEGHVWAVLAEQGRMGKWLARVARIPVQRLDDIRHRAASV
jgi:hypothetical protein